MLNYEKNKYLKTRRKCLVNLNSLEVFETTTIICEHRCKQKIRLKMLGKFKYLSNIRNNNYFINKISYLGFYIEPYIGSNNILGFVLK